MYSKKKVLWSPSPPTKFQGKQSFTAEKLWSFRTQFLCHLPAVFLVSCTNQPYLTGGSNILPTHPPTCTSWYRCVTHMINTWESNLLFSSFSSSISKYISDLVMDMVPLMAAPGAISLQAVDRATGPVKPQRQWGLLFALYSCHFTDITYIQTSPLFVT